MVRVKKVLDILNCVIALLGVTPVFLYLDRISQGVFLVSLAVAMAGSWKELRPLRGWHATTISFLFFVYYALQFSRDNLVGPAVSIIVILLSIRLAGERNARNCLQLSALSLIALAASSQFNLSAVFLVYLVLLILCIAVSLVLLTFVTVDSRLCLSAGGMKRVIRFAVAMPVVSTPLVLFLFLVLPRPQFPIWDVQISSGNRSAGLSDRVEPGSAREVTGSKTVVLRVQSEQLPKRELYWRGIAFNSLHGNTWVRDQGSSRERIRVRGGRIVQQKILAEPTASSYIVTLDAPLSVQGMPLERTRDLVFKRKGSSSRRSRYDAASALDSVIVPIDEIDRKFYLRLPETISPRVRSLGAGIARQGRNDRERVALLERHFLSHRYRYATQGLPTSGNPIDEFLFGNTAGNCEFFASSFALLLRAAGVPSRLVGGYYGGEYNEIGGYYLVSEDMAHVWVEVYLDGIGWVRKDPSIFALNFGGERNTQGASVASRLMMLADSFSYFWNVAVINYDLDRQIRIFRSANAFVASCTTPHGRKNLQIILLTGALAAVGYFLMKKVRISTPEQRLVRKFQRKVSKKYPHIAISPSTGLVELAEQTNDPVVRRFVEIYIRSVYRDRSLSRDDSAELDEILKSV